MLRMFISGFFFLFSNRFVNVQSDCSDSDASNFKWKAKDYVSVAVTLSFSPPLLYYE